MSRLRLVVRPALVDGFRLAGVEVWGADSAESAQSLLLHWLETGEEGLVGLDEGLLVGFSPLVRRRLEQSDRLYYLPVPSGEPAALEITSRVRLAALLRQALGFHIAFQEEHHVR